MLPVIAIVGRPNVGKSTLFNVLTGRRDAIVADLEGLTRDRRYGWATHEDRDYILIDTGGLTDSSDPVDQLTSAQARAAISEAHVVIFMVDARAGMLSTDQQIFQELRSQEKTVLIAVNKTDGLDESTVLADFYQFGSDQLCRIAASHRRGVVQLIEAALELAPEQVDDDPRHAIPEGIRIAVAGRPNVGKSTLINRLLGEERLLAMDMPGTTRDSIYVPLERDGKQYVLIDTAGVRRRARVSEEVEIYSVIKALQSIRESDVTIVLIDGTEGVVDQDSAIIGQVLEAGRALVIAVNKWDGLDQDQRDHVEKTLDRKLRFVEHVERIHISALHGSHLSELMTAVNLAYQSATQDTSSSRLTNILKDAYEAHPPPMVQSRTAKLRFAHLGGHNPFRIIIHGSRTSHLPESYKRYLANTFRDRLDMVGTTIRLLFRDSDNPYKDKKNKLTERQLKKKQRLKKFVKRRS